MVDLATQALALTVQASPAPTDPTEQSVQRGKRF